MCLTCRSLVCMCGARPCTDEVSWFTRGGTRHLHSSSCSSSSSLSPPFFPHWSCSWPRFRPFAYMCLPIWLLPSTVCMRVSCVLCWVASSFTNPLLGPQLGGALAAADRHHLAPGHPAATGPAHQAHPTGHAHRLSGGAAGRAHLDCVGLQAAHQGAAAAAQVATTSASGSAAIAAAGAAAETTAAAAAAAGGGITAATAATAGKALAVVVVLGAASRRLLLSLLVCLR